MPAGTNGSIGITETADTPNTIDITTAGTIELATIDIITGPPGPPGTPGTLIVPIPYDNWPPVDPLPDVLYLRLEP